MLRTEDAGSRPTNRVLTDANISWDEEVDVVVVGSGAAGLAAAFGVLAEGAIPLMLERAEAGGGTYAKSAGAFWIPGNRGLTARGVVDDETDALRFIAKCARPSSYDPDDAFFGLERWEYDLLEAYVRKGPEVVAALESADALTAYFDADAPDYRYGVEENTIKRGRVGVPLSAAGTEALRGSGQAERFLDQMRHSGGDVRFGQHVQAVITDRRDRVVGVRALGPEGERSIRANGGVIFGSGGFTHDRTLRRGYISETVMGGAAVHTNTGDFVHIAVALGLPLRSMHDPWMAPIPLELIDDPDVCPVFVAPGDSMLYVNRFGERVVNEKGLYNEIARTFQQWDSDRLEYPNLLLFMIFDERVRELWGPPAGYDTEAGRDRWPLDSLGDYSQADEFLIQADDLDSLEIALKERLHRLSRSTGGFDLAPGFAESTARSIERFNRFAVAGVDGDHGRGENPIELTFAGSARPGNDLDNMTMFPLSEHGPLYAMILCAGTLDTKGGPVINPFGQVLDAAGAPVVGLYGAGNCVASPFAQGYPAGGVPNGSALIFGFEAGRHAGARARSVDETQPPVAAVDES